MTGLKCSNPECQVATTGKCLEGLPPEECTHCTESSNANKEPEIIAEELNDSSEIKVQSGDILNIKEATNVLHSNQTTVISLLGSVGAGKTTFSISLYNAFLHCPFDKWNFCGSLTLPAFEMRSHPSRMECENPVPETNRTPYSDGLGFLHITVQNKEDYRKNHILISDRTGEFYRAVANSAEKCEGIYDLSRADYTLYLVDGEKLANEKMRHGEKSEVLMLLATLIHEKVIGAQHRIGLVLTKYDLVLAHEKNEEIEGHFNNLVSAVKSRFGASLSSAHSRLQQGH